MPVRDGYAAVFITSLRRVATRDTMAMTTRVTPTMVRMGLRAFIPSYGWFVAALAAFSAPRHSLAARGAVHSLADCQRYHYTRGAMAG